MITRFNPQLKITKHERFGLYMKGEIVFPINIEISPSGFCNASCSFCFYKNKQSSVLINSGELLGFICEGAELGLRAITWTGGGEPTMHPHFDELVSYTPVKQGLITNAIKNISYQPSKFEWIRVSKTDRPWPIENIKKLKDCKTVGLCISTSGEPDDEVKKALEIVYKLELEYLQIRPALLHGGQQTEAFLPAVQDEKLVVSSYKYEEAMKSRGYSQCEGYHFVPFIWEDGRVDVCGYRRGEDEYNLGNIYEHSFKEIFVNAPSFVPVTEECQTCCKNHELNKTIAGLRDIEDADFV